MKTLIYLIFLFNTVSCFAKPIKSYDIKTQFLAIGKPSFIKIRGTGATTKGSLDNEKPLIFEITLNDFSTGISLRDRHMKEKYLETEKYKSASLTIKNASDLLSINKTEPKKEVMGILNLHGKSKEITIGFEWDSEKDSKTLINSKFTIKLGDFGIEVPTYAGITVTENVDIDTQLTLSNP